jgi:hypothetical protein
MCSIEHVSLRYGETRSVCLKGDADALNRRRGRFLLRCTIHRNCQGEHTLKINVLPVCIRVGKMKQYVGRLMQLLSVSLSPSEVHNCKFQLFLEQNLKESWYESRKLWLALQGVILRIKSGGGKVVHILYLKWASHHEGVLGEWRYSSTHSWTRH